DDTLRIFEFTHTLKPAFNRALAARLKSCPVTNRFMRQLLVASQNQMSAHRGDAESNEEYATCAISSGFRLAARTTRKRLNLAYDTRKNRCATFTTFTQLFTFIGISSERRTFPHVHRRSRRSSRSPRRVTSR